MCAHVDLLHEGAGYFRELQLVHEKDEEVGHEWQSQDAI
jgi:hypothetical protein